MVLQIHHDNDEYRKSQRSPTGQKWPNWFDFRNNLRHSGTIYMFSSTLVKILIYVQKLFCTQEKDWTLTSDLKKWPNWSENQYSSWSFYPGPVCHIWRILIHRLISICLHKNSGLTDSLTAIHWILAYFVGIAQCKCFVSTGQANTHAFRLVATHRPTK